MDTPGSMDWHKPTVEDVIRLDQEDGLANGQIGFTQDSGGMEDIIKSWDFGTATSPDLMESPGNEFDLIAAADRVHGDDVMGEMEYSLNMQMLAQDTSLQQQTRSEIQRRLLAAGKTEGELAQNAENVTSLRKMALDLYKAENPDLREGARLKAAVCSKFRGNRHSAPIYLSPKDDFPDFVATLKEFVVAKAQSTGRPVKPEEDLSFLDAWAYSQASHRNERLKLVGHPWTKLANKFDYRKMMMSIKTLEQEGLILVLMPAYNVPSIISSASNTPNGNTPKGKSQTKIFSSSPIEERRGGGTDFLGPPADSVDDVPVGQEDLFKQFDPVVDWANLIRRMEEGEDVFQNDLDIVLPPSPPDENDGKGKVK